MVRAMEPPRRLGTVSLFGLLVLAQAAHSVEEYAGRLWEVFPPARALSWLVSSDLERGFLIINVTLVLFGVWCYFGPVRHRWASATVLLWLWVGIELVNGVGHPAWSLWMRGYTPGVASALVLLPLALLLLARLRAPRHGVAAPRWPSPPEND